MLPRRDFLKSAAWLGCAGFFFGIDPLLANESSEKKVSHPVPGTPGKMLDGDAEKAALRFLVIGDWGWIGSGAEPGSGRKQREVADAMARFGDAHSPAFVLTVGDNFYQAGVKSAEDPRWKESFEDVYAAKSLQVPWYASLGNHDNYGNAEAQLGYAKKSKRWRMDDRCYSFVQKSPAGVSVRFIVMDTDDFVAEFKAKQGAKKPDKKREQAAARAPGQLAWLERTLAESKEDWKIIVGHHPLWTGGVRKGRREHRLDEILPPLMKKHGVSVYLCGHEHDAQHIVVDGIHNLLLGHGADSRPTGATEGTRFADNTPGFGYVTVDAETARVHFVDHTGKLHHTAEIKRALPAAR